MEPWLAALALMVSSGGGVLRHRSRHLDEHTPDGFRLGRAAKGAQGLGFAPPGRRRSRASRTM